MLFETLSVGRPWTGTAVDSMILLAPVGIIRCLPKDQQNIFIHHPRFVPYSYLRRLVGNVLGVSTSPAPLDSSSSRIDDQRSPEVPQATKRVKKGVIDRSALVQWQFDYYRGPVHSFINTIKYGPLLHQHANWEEVCNVIEGETDQASSRSSLFNRKILIVFGVTDGVVVEKEVVADLSEMIDGREHVTIRNVSGGHDFPLPCCDEVANHISEIWDLHIED